MSLQCVVSYFYETISMSMLHHSRDGASYSLIILTD